MGRRQSASANAYLDRRPARTTACASAEPIPGLQGETPHLCRAGHVARSPSAAQQTTAEPVQPGAAHHNRRRLQIRLPALGVPAEGKTWWLVSGLGGFEKKSGAGIARSLTNSHDRMGRSFSSTGDISASPFLLFRPSWPSRAPAPSSAAATVDDARRFTASRAVNRDATTPGWSASPMLGLQRCLHSSFMTEAQPSTSVHRPHLVVHAPCFTERSKGNR